MDVRGVRPEQTTLAELLLTFLSCPCSPPDVRRDASVGLPREFPMVPRHLEVGELRTRCRREGELLVLRREVLGGGSDEPARLTLLPLPPPREPVREDRTEPGVVQRLDHRVGVGGRALDVRPVEQRRDTRIDRPERRDQVADVRILGSERRCELVQDERDVAGPSFQRDVGPDVAEQALPDVTVGVDEPGHDDHVRRVDDLHLPVRQRWAHGDDPVAFDEHVARVRSPIVGSRLSTVPPRISVRPVGATRKSVPLG